MAENVPSTSGVGQRRRDEERRPYSDEELLRILLESDIEDLEETDFESGEETEDEDADWTGTHIVPLEPEGTPSTVTQVPAEHHILRPADVQTPQPSKPSRSFVWQEERPDVPHIPFTGSQTLKCPPPENPLGYFEFFFTDELLEHVIEESNINAERILLNSTHPTGRISAFRPITRQEIEIFFGLVYLMGLYSLPVIADYWRKTECLYDFPIFRAAMSRNRFLIILRTLHFARNEMEGESKPLDPLYKIRPLLDMFLSKLKEIYSPGKDLSIDESMLLWRGRLSFRQFIKGKRHKFGIKLYMLAESNGLVLDILIYTGSRDPEVEGKGHAEKVVRKLMQGLIGVGHSLYVDNYYSSVNLCCQLLDENTYMTGTLRNKRKNNPVEVASKKLRPGESVHRFLDNGVCVLKWCDKREVLVISSEHGPEPTDCASARGVKRKPNIIVKYNKEMGGIDRADQFLAYYPLERKTLRWYLKVGLHIFHLMANNSWVLYKRFHVDSRKMPLKAFRELIAQSLIKKNKPPPLNHPYAKA